MSLKNLLRNRKKNIIKKWQEEIFLLYPSDSVRFLTSEAAQFANPVGHAIREHTAKLYSELETQGDINREKISQILDVILSPTFAIRPV